MLRGVIRKCSWLKCLSFGVGRFVGHVEQRGVVDAVGGCCCCCWCTDNLRVFNFLFIFLTAITLV